MSLNPYYIGGSEEVYQDLLDRLGRSFSRPRSGVLGSGDGTLGVRVDDDVWVGGVAALVPQEGLYGVVGLSPRVLDPCTMAIPFPMSPPAISHPRPADCQKEPSVHAWHAVKSSIVGILLRY
jgi:hypothetical protein